VVFFIIVYHRVGDSPKHDIIKVVFDQRDRRCALQQGWYIASIRTVDENCRYSEAVRDTFWIEGKAAGKIKLWE
jgi:hypothetical protein